MENAERPFKNRLSREKSPYLLQHAGNPVDWHPWSPAAFEKAQKEDKPILLSIGYSTCHWCHVMEKESFENEKTARLMNEHYVSIKVDREERPDIDSVYMSYVMATTGSGGWPMTVFLTPEGKPFYGGTYFPPEGRHGLPGFPDLLNSVAKAWKTQKDEILNAADSAVHFLKEKEIPSGKSDLSQEVFFSAFERFKSSFDAQAGGFGSQPKFPRPHVLGFLLRYWNRTKNTAALEMVEKTLIEMARGGICDQLGGGFHRYSTDKAWRIPHFEKMLYDQALLVRAYLEAYQATHNEFYARSAREILDYVLERMTSPDGGFYSAEDADSPDPENPSHKREGVYYLWKKSEIEAVLTSEEAAHFINVYGIQEYGNAISDPYGEFTGLSVPYQAKLASPTDPILEKSRQKLLKARSGRPCPHLDDKILTDWNGLMIASFAFASRVLSEYRYRDAAVKAAEFVWRKLLSPKGEFLHRYRDGEAAIEATLSDYAFMTDAAIELYEATFDPQWLTAALDMTRIMRDQFEDSPEGGFFLTAKEGEKLLVRPKEIYDGAVPSGNSVALLNLLRLHRFTGNEDLRRSADRLIQTFASAVEADPTGYTQFLIAFDFAVGPSSEIVLAGSLQDPFLEGVLKEIHLRFMPNKIIILQNEAMRKIAPFIKEQGLVHGKPAVTICRNHACQLPVTEMAQLRKALE